MANKVQIVVGMVFEFEGVSEEEARAAVQEFVRPDPNKPGPRGMRRASRFYQVSDAVKQGLLEQAAAQAAASQERLRQVYPQGGIVLPDRLTPTDAS